MWSLSLQKEVHCQTGKVQNSFTRKLMIRSVGFMYADIPSSNARNLNFGLTSLSYRRRKHSLLMMYKILNRLCGLPPNSFLSVKRSITRGNPFKLVIPRANKTIRKHFFANRVGADYEKLGKKYTIPNKLSLFTKVLDSYLKSTS